MPATACQECATRCQKARLAVCRPTHKATRTANRRPARQRHRHGSGVAAGASSIPGGRILRGVRPNGADAARTAHASRSTPGACQLLRLLACLRHALYDRLGIQFRLALPPLVVASRRTFGHGLHSTAGSQAGSAEQRSGAFSGVQESDQVLASRPGRCQRESAGRSGLHHDNPRHSRMRIWGRACGARSGRPQATLGGVGRRTNQRCPLAFTMI
jgi:hypothetical protein